MRQYTTCKPLSVLLITTLSLTACISNTKQQIQEIANKSAFKIEQATQAEIIYSNAGAVKARLQTPIFNRVNTAPQSYTLMPQGLTVSFYNQNKEIVNTLSAKYGKVNDATGNVTVKDSVKVVSNKGEKLETEELEWQEQKQLFITNKFVKITTPTEILLGEGLQANQNFSWYKINKIRGSIRVNSL